MITYQNDLKWQFLDDLPMITYQNDLKLQFQDDLPIDTSQQWWFSMFVARIPNVFPPLSGWENCRGSADGADLWTCHGEAMAWKSSQGNSMGKDVYICICVYNHVYI